MNQRTSCRHTNHVPRELCKVHQKVKFLSVVCNLELKLGQRRLLGLFHKPAQLHELLRVLWMCLRLCGNVRKLCAERSVGLLDVLGNAREQAVCHGLGAACKLVVGCVGVNLKDANTCNACAIKADFLIKLAKLDNLLCALLKIWR